MKIVKCNAEGILDAVETVRKDLGANILFTYGSGDRKRCKGNPYMNVVAGYLNNIDADMTIRTAGSVEGELNVDSYSSLFSLYVEILGVTPHRLHKKYNVPLNLALGKTKKGGVRAKTFEDIANAAGSEIEFVLEY